MGLHFERSRTMSSLVCVALTSLTLAGEKTDEPKSDYGAKRVDFSVAGRDVFIIHPFRPAADGSKLWVWYAPTIGHHPSS